ncbi:MAG: extensin family protein, partial [Pseudomonadota bacterium]
MVFDFWERVGVTPASRLSVRQSSRIGLPSAVCMSAALLAATLVGPGDAHGQTLRFDFDGNIVVTPGPARSPQVSTTQPAPTDQNADRIETGATHQDVTQEQNEAADTDLGVQTARGSDKRHRWSKASVAQARAVCRSLVRKYRARVTYLKPIKNGACGDPAPVQLKSLGGRTGVTFDPPATVNCPMVAALARWIGQDLQPQAKRHLKARLKSVDVMSHYSCRNVYGRRKGRLSQHARANALDIRGFTTTDGKNTFLLSHWGPTRRDRRRYIAAQKRKQQRAIAERKAKQQRRAVA